MIQNIMKYFSFTLSLLLLIITAQGVFMAHAQNPNDIVVTTSPTIPGPQTEVTLQVQYFLSDLNRARISWYEDGILAEQGTGKSIFSFSTKNVGETTLVRVVVTTQEGDTFTKTLNFTPASVVIVWEAHSHTPYFYDGKALPSPESTLTFMAKPHFVTPGGTRLSAKDLFYEWRVDGVLQNTKGQGNNTLTLSAGKQLETIDIAVTATSFGKSLIARNETSITTESPEVVFYEYSPLVGGLYQNAFTSLFSFEEDETSFIAEPYFFPKEEVVSSDATWLLNDQPLITNATNNRIVTLSKQGGQNGFDTLTFSLESPRNFLQFLKDSIELRY